MSPMISQTINLIQVILGSPVIRNMQLATPRSGMIGLSGTLKVRCLDGSLMRRIIIPKQTRTKANRVPILVRSTISSILVKAAIEAITRPTTIVVI